MATPKGNKSSPHLFTHCNVLPTFTLLHSLMGNAELINTFTHAFIPLALWEEKNKESEEKEEKLEKEKKKRKKRGNQGLP